VKSHGRTPRFFTLDPSGARMFVANEDSDNIVTFGIDQQTGMLSLEGH
jgi:6-phosphogluconolactonase